MNILKTILKGLCLLIIIGLMYFVIASRDLPLANDADLVASVPVPLLSEENNAYYTLLQLQNTEPTDTQRIVDVFMEASLQTGYQCPTTVNDYSPNAQQCPLNDIRDAAYVVAYRATTSLAAGDTAGAITNSLAIVRMADMLVEIEGVLIEQLVSIALYGTALESLSDAVAAATPAQKAQVRTVVQKHGPDHTTLSDGFRAEYRMFKSMIDQISDGGAAAQQFGASQDTSKYRWQPNRTAAQLADLFRKMIAHNQMPCSASGQSLKQEIQSDVEKYSQQSIVWMVLGPNSVGNIFLSVIVGSLNDMTNRACEIEAQYEQLLRSL